MNIPAQASRREKWFQAVRQHCGAVLNPDGSGKIPQFNPPYREPLWILPALYTGPQESIGLANKMVARYNDAPAAGRKDERGTFSGAAFNIFQSNILAHALHRFGHLATPQARQVMEGHARLVFQPHGGARQSDYKFHGANDNMPMLATMGHIFGGEALGDAPALAHGTWMLHQFRRLLSRSAWASEFNSLTYSAVTLSSVAKIAGQARTPELRALALDIEQRLWAETILHYHPGTRHFAGPQSRAYMVDMAGHLHSLHMLFWLVFGPQAIGRDPLEICFHPDGREVVHFQGNHSQNIAEYCDYLEPEFHVPDHLAELVTRRRYPAILRGRSEGMGPYAGQAGEVLTTTYMEEDFSLGSASKPWVAETPAGLMLTYKQRPVVESFRDAATVHLTYLSGSVDYGEMEPSIDGAFAGEKFVPCRGWFYTLQKDNVALLSATANPAQLAGKPTTSLRLAVVFPAHYGKIRRSIIGNGPVREGAIGSSAKVECVSVEAGEVYIHIQPLLPTRLPRQAAVRFITQNAYELLEFINYEGPERTFSRRELSRTLNGMVLTVESKAKSASLEAFHQRLSQALITDYLSADHRYLLYQRSDVEFELVYTLDPVGVQTEAIDGRHRPRPVFESNQIDVNTLPFVSGDVARNKPHFPWGWDMSQTPWKNAWLIGSRGLPDEVPYANPAEQTTDP